MLPLAWDLDDVGELPRAHEPPVGSRLPDAPARITSAWLAKRHDDPRWARALLTTMPSSCHVALALCLDRGGAISLEALESVLHAWGADAELATLTLDHLQALGLGLHLCFGATDRFVAFRGPLAAVTGALRGLTDGPPPLPANVKGRGPGRDFAATLALLAHRSLRLTQTGDLHKAKLKAFVKGTGLEMEQVAYRIEIARSFGLVEGGLDTDLVVALQTAHAFLGAPGTVVLDAGLRIQGIDWFTVPDGDEDEPSSLAFLAKVLTETTVHDGHLCARIPTLARPDGDGHVTASFEVLLGPEADAALTLVVGMIGELKHVDHVLTYKLTPESLARGVAAGVPVALARSELARVCARPLPDTVRALLDDAERRAGRARTVILVEGSAAALDALAGRAGAQVVARPSRECLLLDATIGLVKLKALASTAGIALDDGGVLSVKATRSAASEERHVAEWRAICEARRARARAPVAPRLPDPALRRRFEEAVAQRFAADAKALGESAPPRGSKAAPSAPHATPRPTASAPASSPSRPDAGARARTFQEALGTWEAASQRARSAGRGAEARYLALVAEAGRAIEPELRVWAAKAGLDPTAPAALVDDPRFPALAFLAPYWLKMALARRAPDEVLEQASMLDGPDARNAFGRKAQQEVRALGGRRPTRPGDEELDDEPPDDREVVAAVNRTPTSRELTQLATQVMHDHDLLLRVTERIGSGTRVLLLVPEGVRSRGSEIVLVGEDEDGASRVIKLADIVKVEAVVD
jgi:hypothetical protein